MGLANSGNPDMFGSELFITLIPSPWLDGRYHALGRVVRGMRVSQPGLYMVFVLLLIGVGQGNPIKQNLRYTESSLLCSESDRKFLSISYFQVVKEIGNMGGNSGLPATSIQIQSCKCF